MKRPLLRGGSEHQEQTTIIAWARMKQYECPELRWLYAIPNGAALPHRRDGSSPQASKLKAEGLNPGVSDLCFPFAHGGWHALYIELKYGDNTLSDLQQAFIETMLAAGNLAVACWSASEAIETLEKYIQGNFVR